MSLRILEEDVDKGTLDIQLDNGDYKVLKEIVKKWGIKDRENALRFALALLSGSDKGALCKKEENGTHTILVPADEIVGEENVSKD